MCDFGMADRDGEEMSLGGSPSSLNFPGITVTDLLRSKPIIELMAKLVG